MDKLFVLAIGGTGSRVLKSLAMLLASGVRTKNQFEIVPVIIDPHASNQDLIRTKEILKYYQEIRKKHTDVEINSGFFHHKITTLDQLDGTGTVDSSFTFTLQDVSQKKFKDYPSYNISNHSKKNIAIVGCGNFAYSNIAYYLRKNFGDVIRVSMDKNMDRAASLFKDFNADYYTNNFKKVIL